VTDSPRRLDPPPGYDQGRREIWAEAVARLQGTGGLFRADPAVVDTYVQAVASHRQASAILSQTSVMITRGDRAVENPALAIQRRTADQIAKAARQLGLDRTLLTVSDPGPGPDRTGGARFCDRHSRLECTHHKRRCGCPSRDVPPPAEGCCHQPAIEGTRACYHHAGKTLEAARADGQRELARLFGTELDVAPAEALLAEVRRTAGHVAALRAAVGELEDRDGPDGLFWGRVRQVTRDGVPVEVEEKAVPHVLLAAYNAERDRLVRVCAAALTQGAQAQAVDAAKQLASGLGRLLDVIFAGLLVVPPQLAGDDGAAALLEWQQRAVPDVVPAAIRAWEPG
jgi:P27 family predicted phage terminase small subunit